jgi:hypothetical protein
VVYASVEHQAYIEKKKAEFKAQGKEWVDFSKNPEKKAEYEKKKTSKGQSYGPKKDFSKPRPKKDFKPKTTAPISPKLQDLISAIDNGDAKPVENKKPEPKNETKVSLHDLKKSVKEKTLDKKAGKEKVSSLKDALLKAGIGSGQNKENEKEGSIKKTQPKKEEGVKAEEKSVKDTKAPEQEKKEVKPEPKPVEDRKPKPEKKEAISEPNPAENRKTEVKPEPKPVEDEKTENKKQNFTTFQPKQVTPSSKEEGNSAPEQTHQSQREVQPAPSTTGKYSPDELLEIILKD